jgi:hypothetical protein
MRELCALQAGQLGAHPVLRRVGNGEEQCHLGKSVGARLAHERARLDKGPHALLKKQGIGLRPRDQNPLERRERRISP